MNARYSVHVLARAHAGDVRPIGRIERRRRGTLPPRTEGIAAGHAGPGAVLMRPRLVRMLFAQPALFAVTRHGQSLMPINDTRVDGHKRPL